MSDDKSGSETPIKQALKIIRVLININYPKSSSEATTWLEKVKSLQSLICKLWVSDESGKMMFECMNILYDVMAANSESVTPAVWNVLEIVDESKIRLVVKGFLDDSNARLKNALSATIDGLCQRGPQIPILQTWVFAFIDALEAQENYLVLVSTSQAVIGKLLQGLLLPQTRGLIYPVFERMLFPIFSPHVFYKIIHRIPEVLATLEKEKNDSNAMACLHNFSGLVRTLMSRFPVPPQEEDKYDAMKMALSKAPDAEYKPRSPVLWNTKDNGSSKLTNIFQCPVCYERLVTPIRVCENGHCVCNYCLDHLRCCPLCMAHFSNIRMTLMNQIIEMTKFPCKNADSGCDVVLLYLEIGLHELECEYRSVACELEIDRFNSGMRSSCMRDVVLANFHQHVEKFHQSYISEFELNKEKRGVLNYKKRANHIRVLKDENSKLYFIERIYITEEELFFSYHYIGKNADAKNYIYTIKIDSREIPNQIKYSHFCLPNYMSIDDTEASDRCLVLDPHKILDIHLWKPDFCYSVKIEVCGIYRLRKTKSSSLNDDATALAGAESATNTE